MARTRSAISARARVRRDKVRWTPHPRSRGFAYQDGKMLPVTKLITSKKACKITPKPSNKMSDWTEPPLPQDQSYLARLPAEVRGLIFAYCASSTDSNHNPTLARLRFQWNSGPSQSNSAIKATSCRSARPRYCSWIPYAHLNNQYRHDRSSCAMYSAQRGNQGSLVTVALYATCKLFYEEYLSSCYQNVLLDFPQPELWAHWVQPFMEETRLEILSPLSVVRSLSIYLGAAKFGEQWGLCAKKSIFDILAVKAISLEELSLSFETPGWRRRRSSDDHLPMDQESTKALARLRGLKTFKLLPNVSAWQLREPDPTYKWRAFELLLKEQVCSPRQLDRHGTPKATVLKKDFMETFTTDFRARFAKMSA